MNPAIDKLIVATIESKRAKDDHSKLRIATLAVELCLHQVCRCLNFGASVRREEFAFNCNKAISVSLTMTLTRVVPAAAKTLDFIPCKTMASSRRVNRKRKLTRRKDWLGSDFMCLEMNTHLDRMERN